MTFHLDFSRSALLLAFSFLGLAGTGLAQSGSSSYGADPDSSENEGYGGDGAGQSSPKATGGSNQDGKSKKKSKSTTASGNSSSAKSGDGHGDDSGGTVRAKKRSGATYRRGPEGLAIGLSLGWEAMYGNGAVAHFLPDSSFDLHGGVGYTLSGFRLGVGGGMNFFLVRSFAIAAGASISHTTGSDGDVSLTAKFTPEGGGAQEEVIASRAYTVTSSQAFSPYAGILWSLFKSFYLSATVNYNVIFGGNEVALRDDIQFDKDIQMTNSDSFESEFNDKAKDRAAAGGLGFTLGTLLFL